ncbi:MAG TPA: glycosyltransferase family 2 protein [Chryseolinea sp.]|nr:glycosyltransferase family 2 protein [Chryseolinea sp.]
MAKLLTISIPTYNRASMLDAQLNWLSAELEGFEDECDIVVSDNCSNDSTADVIANWRRRFEGRISFTTNRNDHNIGPMANIVYCIGQATSKFVWSLGDDDAIERGAIQYIVGKVKEHAHLSLILLNGYGRDVNTNKILQERWFDNTTDKLSIDGASEFETFLEHHMGGVLFISSAVYRTDLVHQAFAVWPDSANNMASQAFWVAYCAARGSFIVTSTLFTECAMGIGFTDKDPKWTLTIAYRAIPEVYIRLMRSGYSRRFCFNMMLHNVKSFSMWRVMAGGIRRWPLFATRGLVYYIRGLIVGAILFLCRDNKEIIDDISNLV